MKLCRPLLAALVALGCAEERIDQETTLVNLGETGAEGSTDGTSTDGGPTGTHPCDDDPANNCCVPQGYLPGECDCAEPGEPCFDIQQGCAPADGLVTCDDLCAQIGQTCVADACTGTAITGTGTTLAECPHAANYGTSLDQDCNDPIPIAEPGQVVVCCCDPY